MQNKQYSMEELYPVIDEVLKSGGEFRLFPRGTSMLPLLHEGRDSVMLAAPLTVSKRDICLYRRADGSFVLHRLMKWQRDGNAVFCGDNQTALEYGISRDAIIARVTAVYHGERCVPVTAISYRLYVLFHCFMPLRRLRFFLRRALRYIKRRIFKK